MNLVARLNESLKAALKAGDSFKVGTLRMMLAAIHNREIEKRAKSQEALTDEEVLAVLRKEAKKRKEAAEIYHQAGREDLREKEVNELKIIQAYLPPEADDQAIREVVSQIIAEGEKEFGKIMQAALKRLASQAEARRVSEIIKEHLSL